MTASLPAGRRGLPRLWLVDTSSLVTMAAHAALRDSVISYLDAEHGALPQAVVGELRGLQRAPVPTSTWARAALTQLDWLGTPARLVEGPLLDTALAIQQEMALSAPLERDDQHWGESAIIAIGKHLSRVDAIMLSEDYDARLGARRHDLGAMSLTRLMHHMTLDGFRTPMQVSGYTTALVRAERWTRQPALSADDFVAGRLGKQGRPA